MTVSPDAADPAAADPAAEGPAAATLVGDEAPVEESRAEAPPGRPAATVVLVVAAVIFAWSVWAAIGNLTQVPAQFDAYRDFVTKGGAPELAKSTPWVALIAALVVPVVGYLAALLLGRRRGLRSRIILFVVAYAAVCALTVSLTGYVFQTSAVF